MLNFLDQKVPEEQTRTLGKKKMENTGNDEVAIMRQQKNHAMQEKRVSSGWKIERKNWM